MLARTPFMIAEQLDLTEAKHHALVLTLTALERGEITHWNGNECYLEQGYVFTGSFNMAWWCNSLPNKCGTVACIGGTAEMLGKVDFGGNRTDELDDLFYPPTNYDYNNITTNQAADVLRNYLTTGHANWDEVLA